MPQTSPMTWLMLSTMIPLTLTSLFSFFSFSSQNPMMKNNPTRIHKKNFNWTW